MIGLACSPRPHEKGGVELMLAGPGVMAAGFALPRDAGRRPPPGELASAPLSRAVLPGEGRAEKRAIRRSGAWPRFCSIGVAPVASLRGAVPGSTGRNPHDRVGLFTPPA